MFVANLAGQLGSEIELYTYTVDQKRYSLHSRTSRYTWDEAQESCSRKGGGIVDSTISEILEMVISGIEDYGLSDELELDVWVSAADGRCQTLKKECKMSQIIDTFGNVRCISHHWVPVDTDCDTKRHYVICLTGKCCCAFHYVIFVSRYAMSQLMSFCNKPGKKVTLFEENW